MREPRGVLREVYLYSAKIVCGAHKSKKSVAKTRIMLTKTVKHYENTYEKGITSCVGADVNGGPLP